MKLILQNLTINNFKGIKSLNIDFKAHQTSIFAANEIGKTTISDAWHWLLTGKNSNDQKDFNIKNTVHTELNRADHEVAATVLADNTVVTLKKIYKEKWVKTRGEQFQEFKGHETEYFCNDVPLTQAQYQDKITGLLPESVLKMITNPLFFNSNTTQWNWQKRREVLLGIAGTIANGDVFKSITTTSNKTVIQNLQYVLDRGKTMDEYRKQIGANKKRLKDELLNIPPRIEELTRSLPEPLDYVAIQKQIDGKNEELAKLDQIIADKNKSLEAQHNAIQERQTKIHQFTTKRNEITHKIRNNRNDVLNDAAGERSTLVNTIGRIDREILNIEQEIKNAEFKKTTAQDQIIALRQEWSYVNAKEIQFDDHAFSCPTCKRAYETDNIEEMKDKMILNFNTDKSNQLACINERGINIKASIGDYDLSIQNAQCELERCKSELAKAKDNLIEFDGRPQQVQSLEEQLANDDEYVQLGSDIAALQARNNDVQPVDNADIIAQKGVINGDIDALKKELYTKDTIVKTDVRINELRKEESTLSQELADLEKTEFLMDAFNKSKMDILESRINGKFQHVTFQLFDRQINGGETPTCETMYKGVPFSDLNTAGKIWAGIDIINTLSTHYGVRAPIFLDNRESVSKIPDTESQVINLVVSPNDKAIRVEAGENELMSVA